VQALRAIAAIAVVTHHVTFLQNGEWGVDLFFAISGFIMCYVTERSGEHFFLKRVIRIVPLYWAGTIAIYCIAIFKPSLLAHTTNSIADLVRSLFFIPFKKGERVFPVLFLGWTLNYEMFFYLLFAISMKVSHRSRALIASALIVAIVAVGQIVHFESVAPRFFSKSILLEFALGMLCYSLLGPHIRVAERPLPSRIGWTFLGLLLIAWMPIATELLATEDRVLRWGIPAALAFYCIVRGLSAVRLPRPLVLVGDASYSLYLFHPYVMQTFNEIFHAFSGDGLRPYLMALVAILSCCGLAVLSYVFLENPILERLRKVLIDRPPRALTRPPLAAQPAGMGDER
jgi:peptidoglycan/LPS O-acetylase OafA/YrhL